MFRECMCIGAYALYICECAYVCVYMYVYVCVYATTLILHTYTLQIHSLNPALPPDYYARVLLGRQPGNKDVLERELKICLSRQHVEVYCTLIEILRQVGGSPTPEQARMFLKKIESIGKLEILNERKLVQVYAESTRRLLTNIVDVNQNNK